MAGNGKNAAFLKPLPPALELRLEEDERLAAFGQNISDGRQDERQRDKTEIRDNAVHGKGKIFLFEIPRVGVVHHRNAGIGREGRREQALAHVDADDGLRAALQEAVGKAARAGAEVAIRFPRNVFLKDIQPAGELIAAVGNEPLLGGKKFERIPFVHLRIGRKKPSVPKDEPLFQRLGSLGAGAEAL